MGKSLFFKISILLLILGFVINNPALAIGNSSEDIKMAEESIDKAIDLASKGNLLEAQNAYDEFNKTWREIEEAIKADSVVAYRDIESNMGKVVYSFTLKKEDKVLEALQGLKAVNEKIVNGGYPKESGFKKEDISLDDFIIILQQTKKEINEKKPKSCHWQH